MPGACSLHTQVICMPGVTSVHNMHTFLKLCCIFLSTPVLKHFLPVHWCMNMLKLVTLQWLQFSSLGIHFVPVLLTILTIVYGVNLLLGVIDNGNALF